MFKINDIANIGLSYVVMLVVSIKHINIFQADKLMIL